MSAETRASGSSRDVYRYYPLPTKSKTFSLVDVHKRHVHTYLLAGGLGLSFDASLDPPQNGLFLDLECGNHLFCHVLICAKGIRLLSLFASA